MRILIEIELQVPEVICVAFPVLATKGIGRFGMLSFHSRGDAIRPQRHYGVGIDIGEDCSATLSRQI